MKIHALNCAIGLHPCFICMPFLEKGKRKTRKKGEKEKQNKGPMSKNEWRSDRRHTCVFAYMCKRALSISKRALHVRKRALNIHEKVLYIHKRALHICQRARNICKRTLYILRLQTCETSHISGRYFGLFCGYLGIFCG